MLPFAPSTHIGSGVVEYLNNFLHEYLRARKQAPTLQDENHHRIRIGSLQNLHFRMHHTMVQISPSPWPTLDRHSKHASSKGARAPPSSRNNKLKKWTQQFVFLICSGECCSPPNGRGDLEFINLRRGKHNDSTEPAMAAPKLLLLFEHTFLRLSKWSSLRNHLRM